MEFVESFKEYISLFTAGIFFVALTSLVIVSMSMLYAWTNRNFSNLVTEIKSIKEEFNRKQINIEKRQSALEKGQEELKKDIPKQLVEILKKRDNK